MAIEVALNSPLADALGTAIRSKLIEIGWATEENDAPLSEYIVLMLVNGKTQDEIATELASDLLSLGPDDPSVKEFAGWLFSQIEALNAQINGGAPAGASFGQEYQEAEVPMDQDMDMGMNNDQAELNAPTGPKSMRNGDMRGRGNKRMLGQLNRAMDRTHDSVLHRVRGARAAPTGPRAGRGGMSNRGNMHQNNRANNIAQGMMNQLPGMPGVPPNMNEMNFMMQAAGAQGPGAGNLFELLQQQNQMMAALSQQLAASQNQNGGRGRGSGRSLFERTQRGGHGNGFRRGGGHHQAPADSENVEMDPEQTVCKYNLKCGNKECKFAHQSPAAPLGTTVDVTDVCTYGAACKNFKCVGRHPSPATKRAHQSEQECKFFPNCTNPKCPFKHPDMPVCRNGADCKVEGCQFTHVQTMCKFNPCTNRYCPFKHEEGQRGTFHDKVWTAGGKEHVSERKFAADGVEELVVPASEGMDEGIA